MANVQAFHSRSPLFILPSFYKCSLIVPPFEENLYEKRRSFGLFGSAVHIFFVFESLALKTCALLLLSMMIMMMSKKENKP